MLMTIYSIIDIIAGITLLAPDFMGDFVMIIATICLIKSILSIGGGAVAGFFFDVMGWLDLLAAISLFFSIEIPFLWLILLLKGIFSLLLVFGT